jgi:quercetin dioxygenase-like cupin family protein
VAYDVVHASDLAWEEREPMYGQPARSQASITDAAKLEESRARMWRYPAHTRGRRHLDPDQEEVFVPLHGTLTMLLGEPPERVRVPQGGAIHVQAGTPLQAVNESSAADLLVYVHGWPPEDEHAELLDPAV